MGRQGQEQHPILHPQPQNCCLSDGDRATRCPGPPRAALPAMALVDTHAHILHPFRSFSSSPPVFTLSLQNRSLLPLPNSPALPISPLSTYSGSQHRFMHEQKHSTLLQTGDNTAFSRCPDTGGLAESWYPEILHSLLFLL